MTPSSRIWFLTAVAAALVFPVAGAAHAGEAIGWATAVGEFANEGIGAAQFLVVLAIIIMGVILSFALTSALPIVTSLCLGAALAANADAVAAALFGAGGGGGVLAQVTPWVAL